MKRRFSILDWILLGALILVYVPLSLWGGSEGWAGDADLLPFVMMGVGAVYIVFESIRLCSPGLVPVLASVVILVMTVPSLFFEIDFERDAGGLGILILMAYLFGLIASSICWFVRGRVKVPLADWSMWLGVHGLFVNFLAVPAVICGHITLSRAKREQESKTSRAIVGLVLGYIVLAIIALLIAIIAIASYV